MKNLLILALYIAFTSIATAQAKYLLPGEETVFSFRTKSGKQAALVYSRSGDYLLYRFGTAQRIELEYPARRAESRRLFKHSAYERGGGIQNEGMHLDYVYFSNDGYQYVLYQTYYARGNQSAIGVKLTNGAAGKTTNIRGILKSQQGSLGFFRDEKLIEEGDELFE